MAKNYVKPERISLRAHPEYSEKWVQQLIAEDPSILCLGDLVLRDQERIQPRAGRLDLLLQDVETKRRYEIELQLGSTDEAHIIRTIEYWDLERKRYPQYDHCAVIVAEDITSRFPKRDLTLQRHDSTHSNPNASVPHWRNDNPGLH